MIDDCIKEIKLEIYERQNEIIHKQADVIDKLFLVLCQYMTATELDALPVLDDINEIAKIKSESEL